MVEYTSTVTTKGQVTIPEVLRKALKIKPKDRVTFELVDGEVRLRPLASPVLASYGAVKPFGKSSIDSRKLRQETLEEIAEQAANEG